jgi:periplasmic protein TonB
MNYLEQHERKNYVGLGVVVVLHILLAWALVMGLGRKMIEVLKAPIETKIIEEVKPPPPPPPENLPPPPKFAPPPPSYMPPPEVQVNPPPQAAPTITTTQVAPPPTAVTISPARPDAPPAPAHAAPARVAPKVNFNQDCERPGYPPAAARAQATGEVRIKVTVGTDGRASATEIEKSSGPTREHKLLDRAAETAIRTTCKFVPGTVDGKPEPLTTTVVYVWKLDE